jgi:hypothetical protein
MNRLSTSSSLQLFKLCPNWTSIEFLKTKSWYKKLVVCLVKGASVYLAICARIQFRLK